MSGQSGITFGLTVDVQIRGLINGDCARTWLLTGMGAMRQVCFSPGPQRLRMLPKNGSAWKNIQTGKEGEVSGPWRRDKRLRFCAGPPWHYGGPIFTRPCDGLKLEGRDERRPSREVFPRLGFWQRKVPR